MLEERCGNCKHYEQKTYVAVAGQCLLALRSDKPRKCRVMCFDTCEEFELKEETSAQPNEPVR